MATKQAATKELGHLPVHPDAWALARLVAMTHKADDELLTAISTLDDNAENIRLKEAVSRALKLLHVCDQSLRDPALVEASRFEAGNAFAVDATTDIERAYEEEVSRNRRFQKALQFVQHRQVLPLAEVPKIVLHGKRWDKQRAPLWRSFLSERIQDRENWGIDASNNIAGDMAGSVVSEFKKFTEKSRAELALKNRRKGAKKARRKKGS